LAQAKIDGEDVIRPYTPISTNALIGCFDLLVKDYGPDAKMSHELCTRMNVGDKVAFKHIDFNVKIQAPFAPKNICMLVGGTGITPMIQALHAILGDDSQKDTRVVMLYGSRTSDDILGREMLDRWCRDYPDRLVVEHVLSHEPETSDWTGLRGYIDASKIQKYFPAASSGDDVMVFVCGPPPMYDALCGPREEKDVIKGILAELNYQPSQVYKF
jgi:cytochrome-b5 reductase